MAIATNAKQTLASASQTTRSNPAEKKRSIVASRNPRAANASPHSMVFRLVFMFLGLISGGITARRPRGRFDLLSKMGAEFFNVCKFFFSKK